MSDVFTATNSLQMTRRAGTITPQATVTVNASTLPNAYVVKFLGPSRHGAMKLYYPPSVTQNTIERWDLLFRIIIGSGSSMELSAGVCSTFNNCLVPASAFPREVSSSLKRYLMECDAQEKWNTMVSFFGVAKNTLTYADGGALITATGAPRVNGQQLAAYTEGCFTVPCDTDWEIFPDQKVIVVSPRFVPIEMMPAGHRCVARLAPLTPQTIKRLPETSYILFLNELWVDASGNLRDIFRAANPAGKPEFTFLLGTPLAAPVSKGPAPSASTNYVSDYAKTDYDRCNLAAASAILLLSSMGTVSIMTDGEKAKKALAEYVLAGNAANGTAITDKDVFESTNISLNTFVVLPGGGGNGNVRVVSSPSATKKTEDIVNLLRAKAMDPASVAKFAGLLKEMGVVHAKKGSKSNFTKQFSAIFATFMANGFVESALVEAMFVGIPTKSSGKGYGPSNSEIISSFLTKLKTSSFDMWQQSFLLFERMQKRVVGIARTGCPANTTGHIFRGDDLGGRQIDIQLWGGRM